MVISLFAIIIVSVILLVIIGTMLYATTDIPDDLDIPDKYSSTSDYTVTFKDEIYLGKYTAQHRVEWIEPGPSGSCITSTCTVADAIKMWKDSHKDMYTEDELALEDFVITHWARYLPPASK